MTAAVALSGGIDSLVAAWLLKKTGTDLIGIHFFNGYESARRPCYPVGQLAEDLGIPLHVIDCRQVFEKKIVKYFIEAYRWGRTPNPCILCNRLIKFGVAFEYAHKLGADSLATGHYARVEKTADGTRLLKGTDRQKDQSYFLAMLTETQLSHAVFPLGNLRKTQVKKIASEHGLQPLAGRESQDICFIRKENYAEFMESREEITLSPGPIVDVEGNIIGSHKGLHRYTVGQRRGISCPGPAPYYVVRIDPENNQLVVGFKNKLYKDHCIINNVNWLIRKPGKPIPVRVKIRYRHHEADAILEPGAASTALIRFAKPQTAVAPGQAAVCYTGDTVAAGGWIKKES